jgi:CBS domain containing-hemolysin-like protein
MVRKGLAGLLSFSIGGTVLMFVLHFMVQRVYVRNIMDWVSFVGWMSMFGFVGFLLVGLGIWLIIKDG